MSLFTRLLAPTTEFSPTVTLGRMVVLAPILQFFLRTTGPVLPSTVEWLMITELKPTLTLSWISTPFIASMTVKGAIWVFLPSFNLPRCLTSQCHWDMRSLILLHDPDQEIIFRKNE